MTKEELEKYAHENRKRLDAQKVKIGDVVKVLRGQFAGETGVVVGIIACIGDYTDPYYEVDMDCEVPDKYKCRKNTLAQPSNVIGGLSAYEFEVIGNRAPMQPTEEIKVGDKVRVSKDIPQFYRRYNLYRVFEVEHQVVDIEDGLALLDSIPPKYVTTLPLKYLTKVNAEAKFKVGDKVVYIGENQEFKGRLFEIDGEIFYNDYYRNMQVSSIKCKDYNVCNVPLSDLEPDTEPAAPTIKAGDRVCCYNTLHLKGSKKEDYMGYVTSITDMGITIQLDKGGLVLVYHESDLELVQPKEQTEETSPNVNHSDIDIDTIVARGYIPDPNSFFKCDWDAYTADLAKEIALKITNKKMDNDPEEVAEYAVSVAKAVVENLKKK